MSQDGFRVTFWGVRGSIPTPNPRMMRYGGNTSCVEMRVGGHVLVFDAGTGLYPLGETPGLNDIDLFLSHTHLDHVIGFPFFSPAYRPDTTMRVWAGHLQPETNLRDALGLMMQPPIFPLTLDFLKAKLSFHDFTAGEEITPPHLKKDGIRITTLPLKHPDRATGYRVDYKGKSACYVTDIEHVRDGLDAALVEFIKGSSLFIYDSTFDDRDFAKFVGWGHSTWQQAVRLADAAGVEKLALYHHDPARTDDELDIRTRELHAMRQNDVVASEGLSIDLLREAQTHVKIAKP